MKLPFYQWLTFNKNLKICNQMVTNCYCKLVLDKLNESQSLAEAYFLTCRVTKGKRNYQRLLAIKPIDIIRLIGSE